MKDALLINFRKELQEELTSILAWWEDHMIDVGEGGFYGRVDHGDQVIPAAAKGSVLNARILWAFSAAADLTKEKKYTVIAKRAYEYFITHFIDTAFGGVYWSVDHAGHPLETKKQTYAAAFAVYGLSEYYKCSKDEQAKKAAIGLYHTIMKHTYDVEYGGYFEAFTREWKNMVDLRLSEKDANEKKSMNTHLHVVEAFVNLYAIWPDAELNGRIKELLELFDKHIIGQKEQRLRLFFTEQWQSRSPIISYGHDIEAAWLLHESALSTGDDLLIKEFSSVAVAMAITAREGLDTDGGLWYEKEHGQLVKQKHWWPQAEAMVGFFNAWEISHDRSFLQDAINSWHFIQLFILDKKNGEWVWGIDENGAVMKQEDKAGIWKCPYHNTRACMELIKRIDHHLHTITDQELNLLN